MGAAALATLVLTGMQDKAIYSKPVDELLAQKAKFIGRPVRAEGLLVHGSLTKRDQPCEYRFVIAKNGAELPVRFAQCVVPDTFRDVPTMARASTRCSSGRTTANRCRTDRSPSAPLPRTASARRRSRRLRRPRRREEDAETHAKTVSRGHARSGGAKVIFRICL
jgi:hypothetical protein